MNLAGTHPWVNGQFRPGRGERLTVISPSTAEPVADVSSPSPAEVENACALAAQAHQDRRWRGLPVLERQRILMRVGELLRERDTWWAELIATEMGMPLMAARFIEVPYAAAAFDYFAGAVARIQGDTLPVDIPGAPPAFVAMTFVEPRGAAGLITPWNFPLLLPSWKLAAALAAGCTAVLKPAPESPLTALALGPLLQEAGVPDGVVNILPGSDNIGAQIVASPHLSKISFTGSTPVGIEVMQRAASTLKRVSLELGGKSPLIIFDDVDLDEAVSQTLFGGFFNAGQVCQATARVLVQDTIHDAFLERLVSRAKALRVGPALDPSMDVGPLIRDQKLRWLEDIVADSLRLGARLAAGGHPLPGPGYYFAPTVLTHATPDMAICQEELFGPVIAVMTFRDEDEAVMLANRTRYGLAGAVFSRDIRRAFRVVQALEAGTVWINTVQVLTPTAPFGGLRQSGLGKELGWDGLWEYLERKTVLIDINRTPMTYF
ncbi:MAG: aldehyde dehydrogenase family protein [Firmicutes bacterium]|nr:aldehyde dehydrogenase family protein [Bacillota bacterium]